MGVNGKCEAIKLLTPDQVQELETTGRLAAETEGMGDKNMPKPQTMIGQRVEGVIKGHHLLVKQQNWGFVSSPEFVGKLFFHMSENPEMATIEFDRDDVVEFDICADEARGGDKIRAKNMVYLDKGNTRLAKERLHSLSDSKREKKERWLRNWSDAPPPDWDCKFCGWGNFGRNKTCNNRNQPDCPGTRPPREEWAGVKDVKASNLQANDSRAHAALGKQAAAAAQFGRGTDVTAGWHATQAALKADPIAKAAMEAGVAQWPALPEQTQAYQNLGTMMPTFGKTNPQEGDTQATLALCLGAFLDLVATHDEAATGESTVDKVRSFLDEVNTVVGENRNAKHAFAMQLAKQDWCVHNSIEVRYKPGRNTIEMIGGQQQKRPRMDQMMHQHMWDMAGGIS